jgi:uncharacterized protein YhbP (UPF0306 family)
MGDKPLTEVPPEVFDYLAQHNTLTLATASSSGLPHAATEVYVNDGLLLYFCTRPDTTTARNIEQNPAVSFAVDSYEPDWTKTTGIQGNGEANVLLRSSDISQVVKLFRDKFSTLADSGTSNISVFRIVPSSIQFIDTPISGEGAGQSLGMEYRRKLVYNIFQALPRHEVEVVAAKLSTTRAEAGDVIVRQGAPADKFFIVVDGEVEVTREDDGQSRTIARLRDGQFFGEMAILRDMPRAATVTAVRSTVLLAMDRSAFRSLVAQSLDTTEDFDQVIQQRASELAASDRES